MRGWRGRERSGSDGQGNGAGRSLKGDIAKELEGNLESGKKMEEERR